MTLMKPKAIGLKSEKKSISPQNPELKETKKSDTEKSINQMGLPSNNTGKSLYAIFLEKMAIEDKLIETGGEITDEMDLIWSSNELELKDKIDNYGYLLNELEGEEAKIRTASKLTDKKVKGALNRIETLRDRLKARLNHISEGAPLRGHIFNFHPYESTRHFVEHPEFLKSEEAYLTIEIREDYWNDIHPDPGNVNHLDYPFKVKDRKGKVSELPEEHPAVAVKRTQSVTIT